MRCGKQSPRSVWLQIIRFVVISYTLLFHGGQGAELPDTTDRREASYAVTRYRERPQIDGYLTDSIWQQCRPMTRFTQWRPLQGKQPSCSTSAVTCRPGCS